MGARVGPHWEGLVLHRPPHFLADAADSWNGATLEQRNSPGSSVFEEVAAEEEIVAVKPQPEFEPLFKLN
jgi:hypothetical protein